MATIVFGYEVDPIAGSRHGNTFGKSQAGHSVKKRPSPINHQTTDRMKLRTILSAAGTYFWGLTNAQKKAWAVWAEHQGIPKPFSVGMYQWGHAGFCTVEVNARIAGDSFYIAPPNDLPHDGVTFTNLLRIDKDTIRATFNPSPAGAANRIFLRQTLPAAGIRRLDQANGYIAEISALNPASPYDFTTHFQHLTGWSCRYWTGTQENTGRRSTEDLWDL